MFDNIGKKIKTLAEVFCWIGIGGSVITALIMFAKAEKYSSTEEFYASLGFVWLFIGPLVSWISSWLMYGFGELIEKTCEIAENTYGNEIKSGTQKKSDIERKKKLEKLREQNLITEEEYKGVILKEE